VFQRSPPLIVRLPAVPTAPAQARRAIGGLLDDSVSSDFADDALLLTSEVVSNATAIGGGCELRAWYLADEGALRVEVADHSTVVPVMAQPPPSATSGRGLGIVDSIADAWGVERRADGKSVWFEMTRRHRPGPGRLPH